MTGDRVADPTKAVRDAIVRQCLCPIPWDTRNGHHWQCPRCQLTFVEKRRVARHERVFAGWL